MEGNKRARRVYGESAHYWPVEMQPFWVASACIDVVLRSSGKASNIYREAKEAWGRKDCQSVLNEVTIPFSSMLAAIEAVSSNKLSGYTDPLSDIKEQYKDSIDFKYLIERVNAWLGTKSKEKVGLVRMLLARLLGQSVENLRQGGDLSELEYQVERTDNCNYAFPQNIERMIQGIGNLELVNGFDGCGTVNAEIKSFIGKELQKLCDWLKLDTLSMGSGLGAKEPVKVWLVACLAKTLKESAHLSTPPIRFEIDDH